MKNLLLLSLLVYGCAGSPLAEFAQKVPVKLDCPAPKDDGAIEALVLSYAQDPDSVVTRLTEWGKRDPVGLACTLRDTESYLVRNGMRASEAYARVKDALKALGF